MTNCYLADDDLMVMEMIDRMCKKHGVTHIVTVDAIGGEYDEYSADTFLDEFKRGMVGEEFGMNFFKNHTPLGWLSIVFGNGDCTTIADYMMTYNGDYESELIEEIAEAHNKMYNEYFDDF